MIIINKIKINDRNNNNESHPLKNYAYGNYMNIIIHIL